MSRACWGLEPVFHWRISAAGTFSAWSNLRFGAKPVPKAQLLAPEGSATLLFPFQPALGRAPHLWWQRSRSWLCSAPAVPVGREPEVALCAGAQNAARNQWGKTGSVALEAAGKKQSMFLCFYRIDLKAGCGHSFLCLSRKGCDFSRIIFI